MNGKVLIVDGERCSGCMLCAIACSIAHTGGIHLDRAHITVWRADNESYVALTCHHCEQPSCAQACPTMACHQEPENLRVVIDETKCIGCQCCVVACPFGHAHYDGIARVSAKCDYCEGDPECVRVCEPRAIRYVHADEDSHAKRAQSPMVQAASRLSPGGVRPSASRTRCK